MNEYIKNRNNSDDETIVAVITPPGEGGIAALRIAGKQSLSYLKNHFQPISKKSKNKPQPFVMRFGHFINSENEIIDEVMAVYMPHRKSYTGLEQVEIFCHGGRQVVMLIQQAIIESGARMAEPGEFSKLAFLSGNIDLAKAESVAEMIAANTKSSYSSAREHLTGAYSEHIGMLREALIDIIAEVEASIDYPEEEIDPKEKEKLQSDLKTIIAKIKELRDTYKGGKIIQEGYKIAIAGRPNAGKSSLFNLLLKQNRALVTPTPGTTRDYLSESIELGGYKVHLIDTAGIRKSGGVIEKEGQKSAQKIINSADLLLWMFDLSQKNWRINLLEDSDKYNDSNNILVGNKLDESKKLDSDFDYISISCKTKKSVSDLKKEILMRIEATMPDLTSGLIVTSARHKQKLSGALLKLKEALEKLQQNETPELTAFDLRLAINEIDEITGKVYNEDILGKIFSKFCIGK